MRKIRFCLSAVIMCLFLSSINADNKIITHSVKIEGHTLVYNCAGAKGDSVILFLHGLFANKEQWTQLMVYFADKGYHTVAPDLPGYGKSNNFPFEVYTIDNQVKLLNDFVTKIDLKNFSIAGNSFGCAVAMAFTQKYQKTIETVALLGGPAGLGKYSPQIMKIYKEGNNPFIPLSVKEFEEEMNLLFNKAPKIPKENVLKIISNYKKNYKKYVQIFNLFNLTIYNFAVDFNINFKNPTLIVWGVKDKVFTVDDAELVQKKLPGSQLVKLNDAGHLLIIENAEKVAEIYSSFLKQRSRN